MTKITHKAHAKTHTKQHNGLTSQALLMVSEVLNEWIPSNFSRIPTLFDFPTILTSKKLNECPVD